MNRQYKYLYIVSSLMLVFGAALGIVQHIAYDYIYLLGAVGYGLYFLLAQDKDAPLRERRLVRMNVFASLLFIISAVFRLGYLPASYGQQLWVLFMLLGLVFMLYANLVFVWSKKK